MTTDQITLFVIFAVVMALREFVEDEHIAQLLRTIDAIRHEGYYVKMAVAWLVCSLVAAFKAYDGQTYRYPITIRLFR